MQFHTRTHTHTHHARTQAHTHSYTKAHAHRRTQTQTYSRQLELYLDDLEALVVYPAAKALVSSLECLRRVDVGLGEWQGQAEMCDPQTLKYRQSKILKQPTAKEKTLLFQKHMLVHPTTCTLFPAPSLLSLIGGPCLSIFYKRMN